MGRYEQHLLEARARAIEASSAREKMARTSLLKTSSNIRPELERHNPLEDPAVRENYFWIIESSNLMVWE